MPVSSQMPSASHADGGVHDSVSARRGVGSRPGELVERGVEPDVAADRQAGLDDRGEQRAVPIVEVVGLPELGGEHGELQRLAARRGDALHLPHREVDVVDRNLVRDDQARRVGGREVVQRVVERARRLVRAVLQEIEVAIGAHLAVEHLDVDAVGVHVGEARVRVEVTGPSPRRVLDLGARLVRLRRVATEDRAPVLRQRGVVVVVELATRGAP